MVDDGSLSRLTFSYYGQIPKRHLDVDLVNGYGLRTFVNVYLCLNDEITGCWYCLWT